MNDKSFFIVLILLVVIGFLAYKAIDQQHHQDVPTAWLKPAE